MNTALKIIPPFKLGGLVVTVGISDLMDSAGFPVFDFLGKHARCDWNEMVPDDQRENRKAVESGMGRVFSAYAIDPSKYDGHNKIYIVTEADRSLTTVMLASEY